MRLSSRRITKRLFFPPAGEAAPRQADRDVFPGCPLIFHLAEALNPPALVLERRRRATP